MNKEERSWALYDLANSAFALIILTAVMPIFFKSVASKGIDNNVSTAILGITNSTASLILAILSPILGVFADYKGAKKKFFLGFLFTGVAFTLLMSTINTGEWIKAIIIFIIAYIGFAGANLFYDSFLTDVTTKENMDWVSSFGFGIGYIGSIIPFIAGLIIITKPELIGVDKVKATQITFIITGLWWLIFSMPMIFNVKQKHYIENSITPIKDSFLRLFNTFKEIKKHKQVFLFLLAYFFYIDGVDTIIKMATAYGTDIGISATDLMAVVLMIQIIAFPFALLYGKLANIFSAKVMLYIGIIVYCIIVFVGFLLPIMPTKQIQVILYWSLAVLVGTSQGGIQALSRSVYGKLIPKEKSAEFFGFYNIFGKFATIIGPALMGIASIIFKDSKYGILSLLILFAIGGFILIKVKIE